MGENEEDGVDTEKKTEAEQIDLIESGGADISVPISRPFRGVSTDQAVERDGTRNGNHTEDKAVSEDGVRSYWHEGGIG